MTIAVDLGRKATKQTNIVAHWPDKRSPSILYIYLPERRLWIARVLVSTGRLCNKFKTILSLYYMYNISQEVSYIAREINLLKT